MAEKLYTGSRSRPAENFALLDKIHNFMSIIYILLIFSLSCINPRGVMAPSLVPFCSAFIVDETSAILFVDMLSRFEVTCFRLTVPFFIRSKTVMLYVTAFK